MRKNLMLREGEVAMRLKGRWVEEAGDVEEVGDVEGEGD